jgi:hypothetical protein
MAQQVLYGSSALAALECPLFTTLIAKSKFSTKLSCAAPQMLREGKSEILLASS